MIENKFVDLYNKIVVNVLFIVSLVFGIKDFWNNQYTYNLGLGMYFEILKYFIPLVLLFFSIKLITNNFNKSAVNTLKNSKFNNYMRLYSAVKMNDFDFLKLNPANLFIMALVIYFIFHYFYPDLTIINLSFSLSITLFSTFFKARQKLQTKELLSIFKKEFELELERIYDTKIEFGQHKGMTFREILKINKKYVFEFLGTDRFSYEQTNNKARFIIAKSFPFYIKKVKELDSIVKSLDSKKGFLKGDSEIEIDISELLNIIEKI